MIRSPPTIDPIPVIRALTWVALIVLVKPTVTPVDTIGDWILLSKAIKALVSCLSCVKEWETPAPTVVRSKIVGGVARASDAVEAILNLSSLSFIAYTVVGIAPPDVWIPVPSLA